MREMSACRALLFIFLVPSGLGWSQVPQQNGTLTITGYSGQVPTLQVNGKSYVEIESLARLTNGSLSFQRNQTILTLPSLPAITMSQADQIAKPGFSKEFLRAGIEEMTVIREWRIAIVHAIQNSYPVTEDWVARYRRTADSKLALASAATTTDADRSAFPLLNNEFSNMQKLSDKYLELRKNMTYTAPDSVENDPLDQQVLDCARGLASLAAGGQFQDVPACH